MKRILFIVDLLLFFNVNCADSLQQSTVSSGKVLQKPHVVKAYQRSTNLSRRASFGEYQETLSSLPQEASHDSTRLSRRMSIEDYCKKFESK